MNMIKLEYIWLDGYTTKNLRSKTKVLQDKEFIGDQIDLHHLPKWTFDGSSTRQAKGKSSDCVLNPIRMISDPERKNAYLVLCEVLNSDNSKHSSNTRTSIDPDWWFGFEQEYVFWDPKKKNILGWPDDKSIPPFPAPQGEYYCGVGASNVAGREIVEEHLDVCLKAGLSISGINAEVMLGQWEYQLFGKGTEAADDLWLSRYLLERIAEKYGVGIDLRPKPMTGNWNGSGMHINFSNWDMRNVGGLDMMKNICLKLEKSHKEFIKHYGEDNALRLTGEYETQHIDKFSYGVSDRGASIRIPLGVANDGYRGYLEDRRPAANADPYKLIDLVSNLSKIKETNEVL